MTSKQPFNRARMLDLANHLDKLPDHKFHMSEWHKIWSEDEMKVRLEAYPEGTHVNKCGTTACLAGWASFKYAPSAWLDKMQELDALSLHQLFGDEWERAIEDRAKEFKELRKTYGAEDWENMGIQVLELHPDIAEQLFRCHGVAWMHASEHAFVHENRKLTMDSALPRDGARALRHLVQLHDDNMLKEYYPNAYRDEDAEDDALLDQLESDLEDEAMDRRG